MAYKPSLSHCWDSPRSHPTRRTVRGCTDQRPLPPPLLDQHPQLLLFLESPFSDFRPSPPPFLLCLPGHLSVCSLQVLLTCPCTVYLPHHQILSPARQKRLLLIAGSTGTQNRRDLGVLTRRVRRQ